MEDVKYTINPFKSSISPSLSTSLNGLRQEACEISELEQRLSGHLEGLGRAMGSSAIPR